MIFTEFRIMLLSSEKVVMHMHSRIVKRRRGGGVAVKSYACETPIHKITQEDKNDLLSDGYRVDYDWLLATGEKQAIQEKLTKRYINRDITVHRRAACCRQDAVKLDGMNK